MSADAIQRFKTYSRDLWPALLNNARLIVTRHENGEECNVCPCFKPGRCSRLRAVRHLLADPELRAVKQQAVNG
ncbi:hypothetical protein [Micromonospora sp. NPDC004704]